MMTKKAVLVLDVINELVHPEGSVGHDGFYEQSKERNIIKNITRVLDLARKYNMMIIYVVFGFSKNYAEWLPNSKLFKHVKGQEQAILGSWATQICDELLPKEGESVITKHQIDPFLNTNLDMLLRLNNIEEVILTGVSSEFVVLSTALSAHDRNYNVQVLEDCIASSDKHSHECAVHIISKIANIVTINELTFK